MIINSAQMTKDWVTEAGLQAIIVQRSSLRADYYCGYVAIGEEHSLYEKHYDECDSITAHGGITFSGNSELLPEPKWWFGFDCNHVWDTDNPKDLTFVIKECEDLAR